MSYKRGGMNVLAVLGVTLGFILFDIISGIIKAIYKEGLNSTVLRQGLFHKLSEVLAVGGSWLLEYAIAYVNLGISLPLINVVSIYICIMELISIIENICAINPKLYKLFQPYLEKLKGDNDDETRH